MGICLQVAYRQGPSKSVPAPWDATNPSALAWWDHIAAQCHTFAANGVTAILLPPCQKTQSGDQITGDGYGLYDDYDIGSKNQNGAVATRFGTAEQLRRLCAVAAANGIDVYLDMVPHQRIGGNDGEYRYVASGGSTAGRFPKHKGCFCSGPVADGWAAHDHVAGDPDFGFGDELCPINATPPDYVAQGLIDAGDWLTRTLGAEGYRIDDTKGQNAGFVRRWVTSASMAGKYAVGEFDDGNPDLLNAWVWNSIFQDGVEGTCSVFDFALHYVLEAMCNGTSRWNMEQLDHAGYAGRCPTRAMTFVENPDTDTDGFATIVWNKAQAYFYLLTSEGYSCLYYKDWSTDAGCYGYGMQPHIDTYCWIATRLANGTTTCRHKDYQCIVYERQGAPGLLCGINNDAWNGWRTLYVQTAFGPNRHLHDYTGHAGDVWTNADGCAQVSIPPNDNGLGTVAYAPAGLDATIVPSARSITQTFFGASDLDIAPLTYARQLAIGRVWCRGGTTITLGMVLPGATDAPHACTVIVEGPDNLTLGRVSTASGSVRAAETGWHRLSAIWTHENAPNPLQPFELTVTYHADVTT